MSAVVGVLVGVVVALATPFGPDVRNWAYTLGKSQPASVSFLHPMNGTTMTGQHLAATLRVSNYRNSNETLWVAVRTPRENTWFPVSKIEHIDGDQQVDVVVGSAAVEQGNFQVFVLRSSNSSDGQLEAYVEAQKAADASAAWTRGLPKLPEGIATLENSLTVYRNS